MAAPKTDTTIKIKISLPDVWTLDMYQAYWLALVECNKNFAGNAAPYIERFYGALALIKAGFVHVEGIAELQALLKDDKKGASDLRIMGLFNREIVSPMLREMETDPLS